MKAHLAESASPNHIAETPEDYAGSNDAALTLALEIDAKVKDVRPNGWRGIQARENVIKAAMLPLLGNDVDEVERVFLIIKAQKEY